VLRGVKIFLELPHDQQVHIRLHFKLLADIPVVLRDALLTIQNAMRTNGMQQYVEHFWYALSANGVTALQECLLTPQQIVDMPSVEHVRFLLHNTGIAALREGLINPEQAIAMPSAEHLLFLLLACENGLTALREGLLTAEQAFAMEDVDYLWYTLCDNGITALREGLLTPEQVMAMPSVEHLQYLLVGGGGLRALREGLITVQQLIGVQENHATRIIRRILATGNTKDEMKKREKEEEVVVITKKRKRTRSDCAVVDVRTDAYQLMTASVQEKLEEREYEKLQKRTEKDCVLHGPVLALLLFLNEEFPLWLQYAGLCGHPFPFKGRKACGWDEAQPIIDYYTYATFIKSDSEDWSTRLLFCFQSTSTHALRCLAGLRSKLNQVWENQPVPQPQV
jgi:hypothetical protein